jgi:hypothetical protein
MEVFMPQLSKIIGQSASNYYGRPDQSLAGRWGKPEEEVVRKIVSIPKVAHEESTPQETWEWRYISLSKSSQVTTHL